jgi:hypothetical protein|tara:strand:- start:503 stop:808 length:306 start_codon:yes stop_codon:yes gene_type:complete
MEALSKEVAKKSSSKPPVKDKVAEKTGGMTRWFTEQYFQTYEMVSRDPRYKTLPPYNQTSCIATVMIATNAALDKIRDAKKVAAKLEEISKTHDKVERKSA